MATPNEGKEANHVGSLVSAVGVISLVLAIITGLVLSVIGESIIPLLIWGVAGVLLWIFLSAFAEVIFILDDIRHNIKKSNSTLDTLQQMQSSYQSRAIDTPPSIPDDELPDL